MQRRRDPSVIEALLAEPQRFKFFQAVRVLELWFARQEGTRARNAVPAHLRFLNSSSLGFPASEIAGLTAYDKDGQALDDAQARERVQVRAERLAMAVERHRQRSV